MVLEKQGRFQCGECKLWYAEKAWAEKCESWCKAHQSCNIEIIKHAMPAEE